MNISEQSEGLNPVEHGWQAKLDEWLKTNSPTIPAEMLSLREEFNQRFPKEKIVEMTLEEYVLGTENFRDSFCYWLEWKTRDLGSIKGGSSSKFGVWKTVVAQSKERANSLL